MCGWITPQSPYADHLLNHRIKEGIVSSEMVVCTGTWSCYTNKHFARLDWLMWKWHEKFKKLEKNLLTQSD